MAKQRRTNSIVGAISAVTAALRLESIPNPTDEQKQQIHDAKVKAADVIDDSGMVTLAEVGDDGIETMHQAEAILEEAGIDPVEFQRQNALDGVRAVAEAETEARAAAIAEAEAEEAE
jgi:hypothetical protein